MVATLVDHGLTLSHDKQAKDRLIRFLKLSRPDTLLETVDRMGWCDDECRGFVVGETLIGRQDVLPLIPAAVSDLSVAGDADTWKREIGAKCRRNPPDGSAAWLSQ